MSERKTELAIKIHATRPGYLSIQMFDHDGHYLGETMMNVERARVFADFLQAQAKIALSLKNEVDLAVKRDTMYGTKEIR